MLVWGGDKRKPTRGVSPDRYCVSCQACSTCARLKSVDDLLLLKGRSATNVGRNEYDYKVYALDLYVRNLKLFHDSHIISLCRQTVTPIPTARIPLLWKKRRHRRNRLNLYQNQTHLIKWKNWPRGCRR
jgi:hypothetical protein